MFIIFFAGKLNGRMVIISLRFRGSWMVKDSSVWMVSKSIANMVSWFKLLMEGGRARCLRK